MSPRDGLHPGGLQGPGHPKRGSASLLLVRVSLGVGVQTEMDTLRPLPASLPGEPYCHGTEQAGGWLTSPSSQRCGMRLALGFTLPGSPSASMSVLRHKIMSLPRARLWSEA